MSSMAWSHFRWSGRVSKDSLLNTSSYSWRDSGARLRNDFFSEFFACASASLVAKVLVARTFTGAGGADLYWFRVQPSRKNPVADLIVVRFHIVRELRHRIRRAVVRIKRVGGVTLFLFVFFVLLNQNGVRTLPTRLNAFLKSLFFLACGFTFRVAGAATCGAPGHLHGACLPIYLRVVFL